MHGLEGAQRERDPLDALDVSDSHGGMAVNSGVGVKSGLGTGVPKHVRSSEVSSVLHVCTRRRMGRMMVFTVHLDRFGNNIYFRVVMLDTTTKSESHLTILAHATQRILDHLRLNREMIEQRKAEIGKVIVDNIYMVRHKTAGNDALAEELDGIELCEGEDIDYRLRFRDIISETSTADMPSAVAQLEAARETIRDSTALVTVSASKKALAEAVDETMLVWREERWDSGRKVIIAFYGETTKEDIMQYSHNFRIRVSDHATLNVLATRDVHEDDLEPTLFQKGLTDFLSATKTEELCKEVVGWVALRTHGDEVLGIDLDPSR
mmetsp:Transcript_4061/g.9026  ORF Transcript_4061/g.9026 Transcript_4061/m.9026 type:complete len:322 (+) Transcript_4061:3-968(+)